MDKNRTGSNSFISSFGSITGPGNDKIGLSQVFDWYRTDFGGRKGALEFILRCLDDKEKASYLKDNMDRIGVEYLFYDWNLNH